MAGRGQDTLYWLHTDHLGSTSEASTATASLSGQERYFPYGQVRYSSGSIPTTYNYTGQRLDGTGLLFYGARYYHPLLGRFVQADTIVPNPANPQSLNRYAYVLNNPLRYTDPTGHEECADGDQACWENQYHWQAEWYKSHGYKEVDGEWVLTDSVDLVAFYAGLFGIPYDLLYVTLITEQLDDWGEFTDLMSDAWDYNSYHLNPFYVPGPSPYNEQNPGPAYFNVHVGAVRTAQKWFAEKYAGTEMANLLAKDPTDTRGILYTLATDDGNIRYMAAYLRYLADVRTGRNESHIGDLDLVDQANIYAAYRQGIDRGFGSVVGFQTRDFIKTDGFSGTYVRYYYQYVGLPYYLPTFYKR